MLIEFAKPLRIKKTSSFVNASLSAVEGCLLAGYSLTTSFGENARFPLYVSAALHIHGVFALGSSSSRNTWISYHTANRFFHEWTCLCAHAWADCYFLYLGDRNTLASYLIRKPNAKSFGMLYTSYLVQSWWAIINWASNLFTSLIINIVFAT